MHRAGVERLFPVAQTQKTRGLLKRFFAEARHLLQFRARFKRTILIAIRHNVGRQRRAKSGNVTQQLFAGSIEFHADAVHATDHHIVEAAFEGRLLHIVLILADANRFRVQLYKFRERIHEASPDGNRAAHSQVLRGEFFARNFRGRIN